jgi:hypothetical protein
MNKPEIKKNSKLTNLEVLQLHADLKALKIVPGIKLNYAIARTIQNLKPLAEAYSIDLLIPKSEAFLRYEEALRKAYADLSASGGTRPKTRIVQTPGGEYETFDIDINSEEAILLRAKLQMEHSQAIEGRKADVKEYNEWLISECKDKFRIYKVSLSEMPQHELPDYKALWDACSLLIEEES